MQYEPSGFVTAVTTGPPAVGVAVIVQPPRPCALGGGVVFLPQIVALQRGWLPKSTFVVAFMPTLVDTHGGFVAGWRGIHCGGNVPSQIVCEPGRTAMQ